MEKIALYRKYRPVDFKNVYGQKAVIQTLTNAIKHDRINHAYIFAGNKGSGKTSMAKILSKAVNCTNPIDGNPCNQCENCVSINTNICMDIIELDAASNSGINEIKNVIESIVFMPSQLKYKIYIIDEAHMLTNNSWNALLKTLEEPPPHAILIFATTEYHKIPATIVSRCQRYDFNKISRELLNKLVATIASKEKITIDAQAIDAIALLANGAARDALSILDQLASYSNNKIDTSLINEMFGLLDINAKIKYINSIANAQVEQTLELVNSYNQMGINFNVLIYEIIQLMMDKMIFLTTKNPKLMQILDTNTVELVTTRDCSKLLQLIGLYNDSTQKLKNSEHPKFVFEYISITACNINTTNELNLPKPTPPVASQSVFSDKPAVNKFSQSNKPEEINLNAIAKPTPIELILELPEISEKLFSTSSKIILHPITPEAIKHQTALFEVADSTEELIEETDKIDIPITNMKPTDKIVSTQTKKMDEFVINSSTDKIFNGEDIYHDDYKNTFFAIAHHHDKNKKDKFNQVLSELKELPNTYGASMNAFFNADKFLVISENGAVLLFDEEAQVIRFNKIANTKTFADLYQSHFNCQQVVLGVYKLQALGWKKEYQNLVKKDFKDVKINNVFNDERKTMLLDILNLKDFDNSDDSN